MLNPSQLFSRTMKDLSRTDPFLYNNLKGYRTMILNAVNKVCSVTGKDPDAVFQDILLAVVEARCLEEVPLYRWWGSVWEMDGVYGDLCRLRPNRCNRRDAGKEFMVSLSEVEPVVKCKFSSMIYTKISQTCLDMLHLHFSRKNGYERLPEVSGVRDVVKMHSLVEGDCEQQIDLRSSSPEEEAQMREALRRIYDSVSDGEKEVLVYMVQNPGSSSKHISREFGISKSEARECYRNIEEVVYQEVS